MSVMGQLKTSDWKLNVRYRSYHHHKRTFCFRPKFGH